MRRTCSGFCARAASGQTAAPPRSAMNSRRLMGLLKSRGQTYHIGGASTPLCITAKLIGR